MRTARNSCIYDDVFARNTGPISETGCNTFPYVIKLVYPKAALDVSKQLIISVQGIACSEK
jgi:hypothetical protein